MIAPQISAKTMGLVKTLSTPTTVNVFLDSMGQNVKTVCSKNLVSDKQNPKPKYLKVEAPVSAYVWVWLFYSTMNPSSK